MAMQTKQTQDRPSTDRIEKRFEVRAPRARVWRAIADANEFGAWFGLKLEGAFAPGRAVRGRLTIAKYDHLTLELQIERIDPEHYFSYRWHPYAIDRKSTRLNSSHLGISYAVFCLKKKNKHADLKADNGLIALHVKGEQGGLEQFVR